MLILYFSTLLTYLWILRRLVEVLVRSAGRPFLTLEPRDGMTDRSAVALSRAVVAVML